MIASAATSCRPWADEGAHDPGPGHHRVYADGYFELMLAFLDKATGRGH